MALPIQAIRPKAVQVPECEGCHKDVKRITKYAKTGQWLSEACAAASENPSVQGPPASPAAPEDEMGVETSES